MLSSCDARSLVPSLSREHMLMPLTVRRQLAHTLRSCSSRVLAPTLSRREQKRDVLDTWRRRIVRGFAVTTDSFQILNSDLKANVESDSVWFCRIECHAEQGCEK